MKRSSVLSVLFALLLATSMPATAAMGPNYSPTERPTETATHIDATTLQTDVGDEANATLPSPTAEGLRPTDRLVLAGITLNETDVVGETSQDRIEAANEHLNASFRAYRSERATDREAFDAQAAALRDLSRATDDSQDQTLENVSLGVAAASNETARIAVDHLNATTGLYADDVAQERVNFAERAAGDAAEALGRAESARAGIDEQNWTLGRQLRQRADALDHYREANHQVRRALSELEGGVDPSLRLTQHRGFERNGTLRVPVTASLTDVRPWTYGTANATLTVDGETGPVPAPSFGERMAADSFARDQAVVTVPADAENATLTVRAVGGPTGERSANATLELDLTAVRRAREPGVADDDAGVTVDGVPEAAVSIRNVTSPAADEPYRLSPMVRLTNRTAVENATVRLPIERDGTAPENVTVYRWDPDTAAGWQPLETEIDAENGTATAEVDGFSFFSVFREERWNAHISSTITLEDRHVVGDLNGSGNGSTTGQVDVVFVMDRSSSMSGEPMTAAKEAAKRFVGALHEGERAGVVSYSRGASRAQALTTDHDSVNASVDALYPDGGTPTEEGIRAGLAELEENGYENRSDLLVLLSDGGSNDGSEPRAAARDAANQSVEISTVALGSEFAKDELRDVANITGGDFLFAEEAEDLPDTFERVAENRSQPELVDTDDDGLPDAVEEAGPPIPAPVAPRHPSQAALGPSLNTSPTQADTSGDGLSDSAGIEADWNIHLEDGELRLSTTLEEAEQLPSRLDSSGDGLTDREQLRGWRHYYTDSADATENYLQTLQDADEVTPSVLADAEAHMENRTASARPLLNHSDGDALADAEERDLGTDPQAQDTTGDGASDAAARRVGADPTLHDFRGPNVNVVSSRWESGDVSADPEAKLGWPPVGLNGEIEGEEFSFVAETSDAVGLSEYTVTVDGDQEAHEALNQIEKTIVFSEQLSVTDTALNALMSAKVTLQVEDERGETTRTVPVRHHGFYGEAAKLLAAEGVDDPGTARDLGALSGFTAGAGGLAELAQQLYEQRLGFLIETIQGVAALVRNLEDFPQLMAAMAQSMEAQQDSMNPYHPDEQSGLHQSYRSGWYSGRTAWMALEIAVPAGQAKSVAKNSDRLQNAMDGLRDTQRLGRIVDTIEGASQKAGQGKRIAKDQLKAGVRRGTSVGAAGARRLVGAVPTTGVRHAASRALYRLDPRTRQALTDGEGGLAETYRRATLEAADGDDIPAATVDAAVARIDEFDGVRQRRAQQLVVDAGSDGLRLVDQLDETNLRRMLEMESVDGFGEFSRWADWRRNLARSTSDVDSERVNLYVDDVQRAGRSDSVTNARGLVDELADSPDQFTGQSGEAASAIQYLHRIDDVEAEPGSGRLDLALKEGEEYVEVKTTASEPDEVWTVEKIADTNGKVADANVDATPDNTALELRLRDDSRTNTEIRDTVERGINTQIAGGGTVDVKEIRLVVNGEELAPIQP